MSICFLALFFVLHLLPHHLPLVWKHSSPPSPAVNSSGIVPISSWIYLRSISWKLSHTGSPPPFFFTILTNSFMISLIGSVINPVKSCTTSGHSFFQQAWKLVWGSITFCFFYNNKGIFNEEAIPPDFQDVLLIKVFIHSIDDPFQRVLCVALSVLNS